MAGREPLTELRLDKWLWAARFFKTRAAATAAIGGGKVHVNGQRVKPARTVRPGDRLEILRGEERYEVVVAALNDQRRPATEAAGLYEETPESLAKREALAETRRLDRLARVETGGRPNKRDRRRLRDALGKQRG
ncbi:MAG: RNA-binding protein [Gammaproteobacteria bacterium]|nr:RNA-binding protein [Gammaproteobacteria bacterium]MDX5374335.1 RNA-binding protein [Gammaproteobacteria bacterium]